MVSLSSSATSTMVLPQEVPVYSLLLRVPKQEPQRKTREQQIETSLKALLAYINPLKVFTVEKIAEWETHFHAAAETATTGSLTPKGRLNASIHLCYLLAEMVYPAATSFTDETLQESENQIKKILELTVPEGITVDDFLQKFMEHADEAVTFLQKDEMQAKILREEEIKMLRHAETTISPLQTVYIKHKEGLLALEEDVSINTAKVHKAVDILTVHSAAVGKVSLGLAKKSQQVAGQAAQVKKGSKSTIISAKQIVNRI